MRLQEKKGEQFQFCGVHYFAGSNIQDSTSYQTSLTTQCCHY